MLGHNSPLGQIAYWHSEQALWRASRGTSRGDSDRGVVHREAAAERVDRGAQACQQLSQLQPAKLAELLAGLGAAIDAFGGGFTMNYATVTVAAPRTP